MNAQIEQQNQLPLAVCLDKYLNLRREQPLSYQSIKSKNQKFFSLNSRKDRLNDLKPIDKAIVMDGERVAGLRWNFVRYSMQTIHSKFGLYKFAQNYRKPAFAGLESVVSA